MDSFMSDRVYLFGYPISHSLSPHIHNTVFNTLQFPWHYRLFESKNIEKFLKLLKDQRCVGAAVTMPHKITIMQHLDELTADGQQVGACNTIFVQERNGVKKYVGTNTDVVGVREAFRQNVLDMEMIAGRPGLVIGGGGAARSALYALNKWIKCPVIYIVNREDSEVAAMISACKTQGLQANLHHVTDLSQARSCEDVGAVIGCVPDFAPETAREKQVKLIAAEFLHRRNKGALLEMAYHPKAWTSLADLAQKAGWQVILGTEAMIWQGLEQDRLWTGRPLDELPVEKVKQTVAQHLNVPRAEL
ncbi:MAG: hypothetical protein Q9162_000080 [Coniocarpon cinnabarinum]